MRATVKLILVIIIIMVIIWLLRTGPSGVIFRTVVVVVGIIVIALIMQRGHRPGHYIGEIVFDPSVGLPPEPISLTLDTFGNITANSRMELPEIMPSAITAADSESTFLGHLDDCNTFHIMSYRQGAIPTVFNIPVSTAPNYVMVVTGHFKFKGDTIETTDAKLGVGPVNYQPPANLTLLAPLTRITLKKYTPKSFFKAL